MKNRCKDCTENPRAVLWAMGRGDCKCCGVEISSSHRPPPKICHDCSVKYNKCEVCGKEIEK